MLEIKSFYEEWTPVTREKAEEFYKTFCESSTRIHEIDKPKIFNANHIRGGYAHLDGTIETEEEKKERVFEHYKRDLIRVKEQSTNTGLRFSVIEYVCSYPSIDPYLMAVSIMKEGITILYDDSSISKVENEKKARKVAKIAS